MRERGGETITPAGTDTPTKATHLISSSHLILFFTNMDTVCDLGRLLFHGSQNVACLVVKSFLGVVVTDVLDRLTNHLLVVHD